MMTDDFNRDGISPASEESVRESRNTSETEEHCNLPVPLAGLQTKGTEATFDPIQEFMQQVREALPFGYAVDEEEQVIFNDDNPSGVCGLFRPVLRLRDPHSGSKWALQLEFLDPDGKLRTRVFEETDVFGKGQYLQELRGHGFYIGPLSTEVTRLLRYWLRRSPPAKGWRVERTGWLTNPGEPEVYVHLDGRIGADRDHAGQEIVLVGARRDEVNGTLEQWSVDIAATAVGNPLMIFVIAASLAGPFMKPADLQTIVFNLYGRSSSGKSLLLQIAQSCWGNPAGVRCWSETSARMTELRALGNDGLLACDGFPVNPSSKDLVALAALEQDSHFTEVDGRHRSLVLMSGEISTQSIFRRRRKTPSEALQTRVLDISVDGGAYGAFDDLRGQKGPDALVALLQKGIAANHGHAGPAMIRLLIENHDHCTHNLSRWMANFVREELKARGLDGSNMVFVQHLRRFALVSVVGEMAIKWGLLPWPSGTAHQAVRDVVSVWQAASAQGEFGEALHRLMAFLRKREGDLPWAGITPFPEDHPAGYQDADYYYVRPELFRDEVADDPDELEALDRAGILANGGEQRSHQYKMGATQWHKRPRVYRISKDRLARGSPTKTCDKNARREDFYHRGPLS
ncbi:DUF927 domain-containing protein [Paracoccus fontiphilus]|uniref:DUF927 domain-containing protein n=1 Tax=Paracoccus fontiphilus TaxID=1815556 RepID=A0ABV7IFX5_9RHOB|nr:DUF927 domain-containing protein [Paracoccus fontiphilus]